MEGGFKTMCKLFIIGIVVLLVAVASTFAIKKLRCPPDVAVVIGEFNSKDSGLRASIPKLASEIARCPEAQVYRIIWVGPEPDPSALGVDRRSTFYSRASKTIGYEADVYSGSFGKTYTADDAAIREVAEKGGTLEDFKDYEQSRR
jgi:hypothetical protein